MATTESLLPLFALQWSEEYKPQDIVGRIQFNLTAPLLEDNAKSVALTLDGNPVQLQVGTHAAPDVIITLSGSVFEALAKDDLDVVPALLKRKITIKHVSKRGALITRAMMKSYIERPQIVLPVPEPEPAPAPVAADAPANASSDPAATTTNVLDTSTMTKTELYDACVARGLEVSTSMLKAEIKAILDASLAAEAAGSAS
jgi:hypothetical protein